MGNSFLALVRCAFSLKLTTWLYKRCGTRARDVICYALERLTIIEKRLGRPLVDRTRGGKDGGGAKLTALGYELLADYRGMEGSLNQLTKWYIDLSDW